MRKKLLAFTFMGGLTTAFASAQTTFATDNVNYKVTNVAMKTVAFEDYTELTAFQY